MSKRYLPAWDDRNHSEVVDIMPREKVVCVAVAAIAATCAAVLFVKSGQMQIVNILWNTVCQFVAVIL